MRATPPLINCPKEGNAFLVAAMLGHVSKVQSVRAAARKIFSRCPDTQRGHALYKLRPRRPAWPTSSSTGRLALDTAATVMTRTA